MNSQKIRVTYLAGLLLALACAVSLLVMSDWSGSAKAIGLLPDISSKITTLPPNANDITAPLVRWNANATNTGLPALQSSCKCADIVLVIDDTGSMGGAIANVDSGMAAIVTAAKTAAPSPGALRMGVVTFKDTIEVDQPLTTNDALVTAAVTAIVAAGGGGTPEASDEALKYVVNASSACTVTQPKGAPLGNFRPECDKLVVLVTDAPPGGCDSVYADNVDDLNGIAAATSAQTKGIIILPIWVMTGSALVTAKYPGGVQPSVMGMYASITGGGPLVTVPGSGAGTSAGILKFITDNTPPTIKCPADITQNTDPGLCTSVVRFQVSGGDECPGVTLVCTPPSLTAFPKGTTTVNCKATDMAGNMATCMFKVTVVDAEPPKIVCPANITRPTDPGLCTAVVSFSPAATDNCPGVTVGCVPPSGFPFPKGTTTVNCTATDAVGRTASCSFTVTVADTEKPKPVCPANITQSTDPGVCNAVVNFTATVTDNCPGATIVCVPPPNSTFQKGTTTVTCTATDAASNTDSCSFTVTVVDTEKPKIACPADIFTTTGNSPVVVSYPNPAVSDNCPGVTFVCVPPKSSAFPIGVTTVTCTATDTSSNQSSCSFKVTVEAVKCDTICFRPPQYFLLDLRRVPRGAVLIGGTNYNNDTNTRDLEEIRLALKGNALGFGTLTPLQQLNKEFVAAQLSFILAGGDGSPVNYNVMWSRLHCFGLNLESVTLTNGVTLTRDSMLKELFMAARSAIVENRTADMVTLAGLFELLNGNDSLGRCGPLRPIADLVPIAPNGFTGFCAFSGGTLRITIKNQGDAASVASKAEVMFGAVPVTVATPALLPNESVDLDISVPVGGSPPVTITITADSGNQVSERSKANNSVTIKCP